MRHTYTERLFVVYLKFKFNGVLYFIWQLQTRCPSEVGDNGKYFRGFQEQPGGLLTSYKRMKTDDVGDPDRKMKATAAFEQGSEGVGSTEVLRFFFKDNSDKQVETKPEGEAVG